MRSWKNMRRGRKKLPADESVPNFGTQKNTGKEVLKMLIFIDEETITEEEIGEAEDDEDERI